MTSRERVLHALSRTRGARTCDDCLAAACGFSYRQVAFQTCARMASAGEVARERAPCAGCGKTKNVTSLLREGGPRPSRDAVPAGSPPKRVASAIGVPAPGAAYERELEVERDLAGRIVRHRPDLDPRYRGRALHAYGGGPFVRLRLPGAPSAAGVYFVRVDERVAYVGETKDFAKRWNMGYGSISPRKCFEGGQQTNCRVNRLIGDALAAGSRVRVRFEPTPDHVRVEARLLRDLRPPWNRKGT